MQLLGHNISEVYISELVTTSVATRWATVGTSGCRGIFILDVARIKLELHLVLGTKGLSAVGAVILIVSWTAKFY